MEMLGQSVIVTGGASGIGKATALLLAREGARVFVGDVDEVGGQSAAAQALAEKLSIEFLPLDLTDTPAIAATVWLTAPAGTRSNHSSKTRRRCGIVSSRSI